MRIILLIMALLSIPHTGDASINESAKVEPLLDIFHGKILRDGFVKVPVTTYNKLGDLKKNGDSKILDGEKYQTLLKWAQPVFRMQPNASSIEEARKGTAFHIGNNLVLSNQHVLDPERKNLTKCEDFRILNQNNESFPCKRVVFCDNTHDICLIEMAPKKSKCLIRSLCKNPEDEVLEESPSVKMRAFYKPSVDESKSVIVTAIGNSMGLGIHVSQGRGVVVAPESINATTGIKVISPILKFFAFATKGNSGGAIFDEDGLMIGLVKQQSAFVGLNKDVINPVGDNTYNIALRVEKVIELCRSHLQNEPKTLEKFNQAVIE